MFRQPMSINLICNESSIEEEKAVYNYSNEEHDCYDLEG